jgi:hypothetical protein
VFTFSRDQGTPASWVGWSALAACRARPARSQLDADLGLRLQPACNHPPGAVDEIIGGERDESTRNFDDVEPELAEQRGEPRFPSLQPRQGKVRGGELMPRIDGYRFGHVVVDGEEQTRDVIVLPDRVLTDWWRADGHRLVLADLDDVIEELPECLVVGTGAYGQMRPDPEPQNELRQRGVEVEALPTGEAVRRYGERDPRRTAAALHLTC